MDRTVFKNTRLTIWHNQPSTVASMESRVSKSSLALVMKSTAFSSPAFAIFRVDSFVCDCCPCARSIMDHVYGVDDNPYVRSHHKYWTQLELNFFFSQQSCKVCQISLIKLFSLINYLQYHKILKMEVRDLFFIKRHFNIIDTNNKSLDKENNVYIKFRFQYFIFSYSLHLLKTKLREINDF